MTPRQAQERIEKLKEVISHHRYLYHVLDKPEISDAALDSLKHELFTLEQHYPQFITPDSPTQRVGGEPLDKFRKVEHASPMLSIEDVFVEEELRDWENYLKRLSTRKKVPYFVELKIDGFAVSLRYRKGVFSMGATRGNGRIGEDVTANLKTIESIPLKLELRGKWGSKLAKQIGEGEVEVRGEVYMEVKDFEAFNAKRAKKGLELYANPRNLAAGSIRQLDPKLAASRPLKFMAYDLVTELGQKLHSEEHEILVSLGFKTDPTAKARKDIQEVVQYKKEIENKREDLPFQIDGIVVSVDENALMEELGIVGKGWRGMRAIKFAGRQATTRIKDIQVQVGRTGAVTPVALLEPVQVGGVTVSRATLHNEDEIKRLGVKIGDTVIVERAGDVIPAIVEVLKDLRTGSEKEFRMPHRCPQCNTPLIKLKGEAILRCPNPECQIRKREYLYHFVSRKAFDIAGLGPKIIDQLLEEHLIENAADLFELTEGDLVPLERFGEKSASNTVSAIQQSKKIPLNRFIYALGIRHVGEETAEDLAKAYHYISKLREASKESLEELPDVGNVVADSIYSWFRQKENQKFLDRLLKGVSIQLLKTPAQGRLQGKTFVFTGSLEKMTREEAKQRVRALGGEASESVSKSTSFLVAGTDPGSKLERAKKLGVQVLQETEFLQLLKE